MRGWGGGTGSGHGGITCVLQKHLTLFFFFAGKCFELARVSCISLSKSLSKHFPRSVP